MLVSKRTETYVALGGLSVFVRVMRVERLSLSRRRNDPRASHEITRTKPRTHVSFDTGSAFTGITDSEQLIQ